MQLWIFIGAVSGGLSVVLGAFGAHGLRDTLSARAMEIYQTGCHYQIIHALALVALGIWSYQIQQAGASTPSSLNFTGWAFTAGTIVFSGSLYALALTDIKILGAITPIGGLAFILGWASLAVSAWRVSK